MPTCLVIQHLEVEGPYAIGAALAAQGIDLRSCRVDLGDQPPRSLEDIDGILVMGGPMGAHSDDGFPTRQAELELLRAAIDGDLPVLGICLGAQLLAVAAGARAYPGEKGVEIGWDAVTLTSGGEDDLLFGDLAGRLKVFQWHGDTFDLPTGATLLASSERYAQQAFRIGSAWGLQFHPEVTPAAIEAFAGQFTDEMERHGITDAALLDDVSARVAALGTWRDDLFGRFATIVARATTPVG